MIDELFDYGNNIFGPCSDYYQKQFLDPDVGIYRLQNSTITAQIFDTFLLMEDSIEIIHELDYELAHFGYTKYVNKNII